METVIGLAITIPAIFFVGFFPNIIRRVCKEEELKVKVKWGIPKKKAPPVN